MFFSIESVGDGKRISVDREEMLDFMEQSERYKRGLGHIIRCKSIHQAKEVAGLVLSGEDPDALVVPDASDSTGS